MTLLSLRSFHKRAPSFYTESVCLLNNAKSPVGMTDLKIKRFSGGIGNFCRCRLQILVNLFGNRFGWNGSASDFAGRNSDHGPSKTQTKTQTVPDSVLTRESRKRVEYGFGEYSLKHRAQWVFWPSRSSGEKTQWVPLSLLFVWQSELTEFFAELTEFAPKLSEAQWVLFSETVPSKQYSARFSERRNSDLGPSFWRQRERELGPLSELGAFWHDRGRRGGSQLGFHDNLSISALLYWLWYLPCIVCGSSLFNPVWAQRLWQGFDAKFTIATGAVRASIELTLHPLLCQKGADPVVGFSGFFSTKRLKNKCFFRSGFGRTDFSRIFIFWPPDFFADFLAGFFSHFCGKKCPEKSSRKIPAKILQNLYNKNPPTHFCRMAGASFWRSIHQKTMFIAQNFYNSVQAHAVYPIILSVSGTSARVNNCSRAQENL